MNHKVIGAAELYLGDSLSVLTSLPSASAQTCVTSPPYFGLRDYGVDGQIGLEETPEKYVDKLVAIFHEVKRVLRDDGTLWLNLGDSYAGSGKGGNPDGGKQATNKGSQSVGCLYGTGKTQRDVAVTNITRKTFDGIKAKDLIGIPWMVAFALRADGWYLRCDIVWNKPNPMPESVTDRPTKAHEYIFLLSKSDRYYYDHAAIKEPAIYSGLSGQDDSGYKDAEFYSGKHAKTDKQRGHSRRHAGFNERWDAMSKAEQCGGMRNKRSVWTVATKPYPEAHFATFPPALIQPCVIAGAASGGIVLDPFNGSGTTGEVSLNSGRGYIGIELNPAYMELTIPRIENAQRQQRMFA